MPIAVPSCVSVAPPETVRDAVIAFAIPKSATTALPPGDQDVVGFDVAVHHALCVGERERLRHIAEDAHGVAHGERPVAREPLAQRFTFDQRHRVIGQPAGVAGGEHRHDVRVLERGGEPHLAREAFDRELRGQLAGQDLHDDFAPQRLVTRDEHARHPATAELTLDREGTSERSLELVSNVHRFFRRRTARSSALR